MTPSRRILVSACMLAAMSVAAHAQSPQPAAGDQPGATIVKKATARLTVLAVDRPARTATLRREDGSEVTMDVPQNVKNFDQIEVGDTVSIEYNEATAIVVRKADAASGSSAPTGFGPSGNVSGSLVTAPLGAKPAAVETHTSEIAAEIENVDYDKRTVTLRGPEGKVHMLDVSDEVKDLNALKKGDIVTVRHTVAVAIAVTK
jgi:hypothetical protein